MTHFINVLLFSSLLLSSWLCCTPVALSQMVLTIIFTAQRSHFSFGHICFCLRSARLTTPLHFSYVFFLFMLLFMPFSLLCLFPLASTDVSSAAAGKFHVQTWACDPEPHRKLCLCRQEAGRCVCACTCDHSPCTHVWTPWQSARDASLRCVPECLHLSSCCVSTQNRSTAR